MRKFTIQKDLYNRYNVLEKTGEGAFATIHKAKNKENGSIWGLKIYDLSKFKDKEEENLETE